MNNKNKLRVKERLGKDNSNMYFLSNGTRITTLMKFPKSLYFFRSLENFANDHNLVFPEKYLKPPYIYGQVIVNGKVIFLDYLEEKSGKMNYILSNILTSPMIAKTSEIYCDHMLKDAEKRIEEFMSFCRKAINQGEVFQETYQDNMKYYSFLFQDPEPNLEFFGDLEHLND